MCGLHQYAFFGGGQRAYAQCPTTETFNTAGLQTFQVPAGVTSITVETWGAGGRGTTNSTRNGRGGGGGGGGYSRSVLTVTPITTYNYTVGAGSTSDAQGGNS